jgi:hypothetical protein
MTHFVARFPQHNNPVQDPNPEDYRDAAEWYREIARDFVPGSPKRSALLTRAESFECTYRRIKWSHGIAVRRNEAERA